MVDDDELAAAIAELTAAVRELRDELRKDSGGRSPRLRPPRPDELLRLTDEIAIPALIAVLEANVRALETFQRGLRLVRRERDVRDGASETADRTRDRAAELRTTTLEQLDAVLSHLERAVSEDALPRDDEGRDLLEEARELRDDVDRRLRDAAERAGGPDAAPVDGTTIPIEDGSSGSDDADESTVDDESTDADENREPAVDVDAELETLRDRYGPDETGADGDDSADDDSLDDDATDREEREGDSPAGIGASDDGTGDDGGDADGRDDDGGDADGADPARGGRDDEDADG